MFIAHLPAGYLLSRIYQKPDQTILRALVMLGAVFPDIDLLWFVLISDQTIHHHYYLTHRPILWAAVCVAGILVARHQHYGQHATAFALGALLHMALDTLTGAINWAWPWGELSAPLVVVPAHHSHWVLSFLTHWTIAVELLICSLALWLWRRVPASPG